MDLVPYDENLLERARTQWQFGDWESLLRIERASLQHHPDRAKVALLIAAAHQQNNNLFETQQFVRLAQEWGCGRKLLAQVLIAGVFNTLGRAAAVGGHEQRSVRHFEAALGTVLPNADVRLLGHARSVHELVRLGMLPEALGCIDTARRDLNSPGTRRQLEAAHAKVVDLEIDWLRERVLQLQKQQLLASQPAGSGASLPPRPAGATPSSPPAGSAATKKYYGLHGLDKKLEAYVDFDDGYYVELGANDGVAQSNTLYFERERNWHGILIEPILHNYLKCRQNRSPRNRFYCSACVSFEYDRPHVELTYSNLMTTPSGLETDIADPVGHAESGKVYIGGEDVVPVLAPAATLTRLLDEADAPSTLDLLSLDVEGAEIEVLKGVDHVRYRFRYMLIECRDAAKLTAYLRTVGYSLVDKLSQHDYLFAPESHSA
jgi:FkbM family methyltransferase